MKIVLSDEAKLDITDAAIWYEKQQRGLGKKFTAAIRQEIRRISTNPQQISLRHKNIRTAVVTIFPYMIHFYVNEERATVIIIGVLHTSVDPKKWNR